MDTMAAFARSQANWGMEHRVFDWDKAAKLIKDANIKNASAGLADDWEYTGGEILRDGIPVKQEDSFTYLSSNWATPELEINDHRIDCFKMKSETDGWDADTFWPESALNILNA